MAIDYEIKESTRARHLRVTVHADGRVVITKPRRATVRQAEAFVREKEAWIWMAQARIMKRGKKEQLPRLRRGTKEYKAALKEAKALALDRLAILNTHYGHRYTSVTIRNQKTRWGSASRRGALSFNYRILYLPPHLTDYIIVHELAHLAEMNHSARFWALVARTIPSHKALRKELLKYSF